MAIDPTVPTRSPTLAPTTPTRSPSVPSAKTLTSLAVWLDGNDINGDGSAVSNDQPVLIWKDKSGNSRNAIFDSASKAVTKTNAQNGLTILDLKSLTKMIFPLGNTTNSYSIFTVQYGTKIGSTWQRLNGQDNNLFYGYYYGTTNFVTSYNNGDSLNQFTPIVETGNQHSFSDVVVNGGTVLNSHYAYLHPRQGYVVEIMVYTGVDYGRQKIQGYLAWKWGLQAKLPDGHPYKSASPI